METKKISQKSPRREFLNSLALGAAGLGIAAMAMPLSISAKDKEDHFMDDADAWFDKLSGKHRIVFDVTRPNGLFPFAWPRVFLLTNEKTGSTAKDCGVVVVLRHEGIPYAMQNDLWTKYKFGETFKAMDPVTNAPALRNPFWQPKAGELKIPGFGNVAIGINELQADGVMFCVCDAAITVYSAATAEKMKMDAAAVRQDWTAGLLPGIQVVPSGVWALGRAQEHQCGYISAG